MERKVQYAKNGMVATSQPLAAAAGLEILRKGGNAMDAAVAAAACLTVVEPTSNGIGSDAFALIWSAKHNKLFGLNASGKSPAAISIEAVRAAGHENMPRVGWIPVTVPGTPKAWAEISARFGRLNLSETLAPAVDYARGGYPVSPILGKYWRIAANAYSRRAAQNSPEFDSWFKTFAPNGKAPEIGEIWASPDHAATLEEIGKTNAESFYSGKIADKIAESSAQYGGFLAKSDLENFKACWVEPICVNYRGHDVWEIPPNGQGIVALIALNILKNRDFQNFNCRYDDTDVLHHQFEAIKLAFAAGKHYVTDPDHMTISPQELLTDDFAAKLYGEIGEYAAKPKVISPTPGGTVYLACADGEGNMVSYIQSNYMGFGSGIVIPNTGIAMQNRGADFSLNPEHANRLEGGKRTYHTIIPGFLTKNGVPIGPFGVMGGYMQPQGHVQVIMNTVDFGMNPQAALDAPRWQWTEGKNFQVENHFSINAAKELASRGHGIQIALDSGGFGRGQIIWRNPQNGVLSGGCDNRCDSGVAVW
ncbi:MAG: gamma-glutamyltransferase family protein [Defluviitaleaceae bacterium]|nr:gamma-glutamyltransferase family protein [Defluviitaleaceae bacterium]